MRHQKKRNRLSLPADSRKALVKSLVTSLLRFEKIETTEARAKAVRPVAEKMITLAKRGDLHARRQVAAVVNDNAVVSKLFDATAAKYKEKNGGYTRLIKTAPRLGDAAPMAVVELV